MQDGDKLDIDGIEVTCMHTPCHTKGHILYYIDSGHKQEEYKVSKEGDYQHIQGVNRCVLSGDTVFLGGCGRFFEGNAEQMVSALDRFSALPEDTLVFCGHEYSVKNLEFGMQAEPDNFHIQEWHKRFGDIISSGRFTVPGTVATEKLINVFMRCREHTI